MRFAAILSIILFVITNHIWCGTVNPGDIETLKAIVIPYRHTEKEGTQVLLSYPEKSGHTKGHCFPGGKANQDDNGSNLATAIRELEEETGYKNARFSHQIFEWTQPDRRQDFDVMTFVYLAEIDEKEEPGEGKDMKSRRNEWVNIEDDIRSKLKIRH
ncbi:secreted protein [Melampsora americana]|nr:secreted protein [Melampsora americana]